MGTGGQKKDRQRDRGTDGTEGHREITTLNTHLSLTAAKTGSRDHGLTNQRAHPNVVCPVCFVFFSSRHFWVRSVKQ